jgi:hypothetical protein
LSGKIIVQERVKNAGAVGFVIVFAVRFAGPGIRPIKPFDWFIKKVVRGGKGCRRAQQENH